MNKCILLILYVWKFVTVQESKKRILNVYVLCIASLFNVLILFLVFSFLSQKKLELVISPSATFQVTIYLSKLQYW